MKNPPSKKPDTRFEEFLVNPGTEILLGPSAMLKLEALSIVLGGEGSLADIARKRGVTRQAAHAAAKKARRAYCIAPRKSAG
jgi:hypothetical protein